MQRTLGRLESKVETICTDVSEMKADVKSLQNFKWRVAGGAAVLAVVLTGAIELFQLLKD